MLQTLDNERLDHLAVRSLNKSINNFIDTFAVRVTLQWIPGHINIPGNERADTLAKQGTRCTQPNIPVSYNTAKQIIKTNKKEEWLNGWATGTTGRCVFNQMTTPNPKDHTNTPQRREQVALFRLRSNHTLLNQHLNRIWPQNEPMCPLCPCQSGSVVHHLFECPSLQDLRARLLPPDPNIRNTLYSGPEQLLQTYRYHVMAMRRRAQAQMTAGSTM